MTEVQLLDVEAPMLCDPTNASTLKPQTLKP